MVGCIPVTSLSLSDIEGIRDDLRRKENSSFHIGMFSNSHYALILPDANEIANVLPLSQNALVGKIEQLATIAPISRSAPDPDVEVQDQTQVTAMPANTTDIPQGFIVIRQRRRTRGSAQLKSAQGSAQSKCVDLTGS